MVLKNSLSQYEKRKLIDRFNLKSLSPKDREFFYSILFDHLETFPFLNILARDVIDMSDTKIDIVVKKLENMNGYQKKGEIGFSKELWQSCTFKNDTKKIAATLWHELMHAVQEKKLNYSYSQRGFMVYRQFIEAEAMSYTNLIKPRCKFEEKLYEAILRKTSSLFEAQKRYIGISTRLRLNADRELAKFDAKNIMGRDFSETDWKDSEDYTIKHWRDFYYKYHQEYAHQIGETKAGNDNMLIEESEQYFKDRYGVKISAKASISKEVIDNYGLPKGIGNTCVVRVNTKDVFDLEKWRVLPDGKGNELYTIDFPNMDPSYIEDVLFCIMANGVKVKPGFAIHSDGFSSRLLQIENTKENMRRFFEICGEKDPVQKRAEEWAVVDEKDCCYNEIIRKNDIIAIDVKNPSVLRVGECFGIKVDFKDILTEENKKLLKNGGCILVGRKPESLSIELPKEVVDKRCAYYKFKESDASVSRLQGYLFVDERGVLRYKECSFNGSLVKKRENSSFDKFLKQEKYAPSER